MLPRWVVVSATRSECIAMDGPKEHTQWAKTEKIASQGITGIWISVQGGIKLHLFGRMKIINNLCALFFGSFPSV